MENAVGVALMVVLVFIVVAIFDGATVQRAWTALSAAFLSFSFIFGNSIRQVCCLNVRHVISCLGLKPLAPATAVDTNTASEVAVYGMSHTYAR